MQEKLKGAFTGCCYHNDDYEACITYSGTAPCGFTGASTPAYAERICPVCRVKWDKSGGTNCPKCGVNGFFTMNAGDIGTLVWMREKDLSISDIKPFEQRPAGSKDHV